MCPLQDLRAHTIWDKETPYRAITWTRLLLLGSPDGGLNIPLDGGYHPGCGEDGFWAQLPLRWFKLPRECIWLEILGTWAIRENEVEPVKKKGPNGLVGSLTSWHLECR